MKDLRIEIDDKSGFCFGVVRAISEAEKALAGGETVYSLGDIVHNRIEVQRLEKLGLSTVTPVSYTHLPESASVSVYRRNLRILAVWIHADSNYARPPSEFSP